MRGDTSIPSGEEQRNAVRQARVKTLERLDDYVTQGVKGATLLNGGGVVAMLGFAQALIGKGVLTLFKSYILWAGAFFLLGAIAAALVFIVRYLEEGFLSVDHPGAGKWSLAVFFVIVASLCFFLVGSVVVGVGAYFHL